MCLRNRCNFPERDLNQYALLFAERLEAIVKNNSVPHRVVADLAIISSQIAHAFDKDDTGSYVYQGDKFRTPKWLSAAMQLKRKVSRYL
jgi:hypothetical protein